MGLFRVVCIVLLAALAWTQETQNCSVDTSPSIVGSTEDAATLATSLQCSNGDFAVQWVGEVFVEKTIYVTSGTSLNITGVGPGPVADGGGSTQLFVVDGSSSLHLSDMTLSNGNASDGGAIYASQSSVSFSGKTSIISNNAVIDGGAIHVRESSTVTWDGDDTQFINNSAGDDGGAIYAYSGSSVSLDGDGTQFSNNSAGDDGGAIFAYESKVSWNGDGTQFSSNSAGDDGGAMYAGGGSNLSWNGDGTQYSNNFAAEYGGAIAAVESIVSWEGDATQFSYNSASVSGGAISASESTVSWNGDGTQFSFNSAGDDGGAIHAVEESTVSWIGNSTHFTSNVAESDGGAIYAVEATVSWVGNGTEFTSNSAFWGGGAVYVTESIVSWDGDGTQFSYNSANSSGGAIRARVSSNISWVGDGTQFTSNSAEWEGGGPISYGGAINVILSSTVSWNGDGTRFTSNSRADYGGAISASSSTVSWNGDGTRFTSNSAESDGGAIYAFSSTASWNGDGTRFTSNSGRVGGALDAEKSTVSWEGDGAQFTSNSASSSGGAISASESTLSWNGDGTQFTYNSAESAGGAIDATASSVSWNGNGTRFGSNTAEIGGAVYMDNATLSNSIDSIKQYDDYESGEDCDDLPRLSPMPQNTTTTFVKNSAGNGGALYSEVSEDVSYLTDVTFYNNSASESGGAVSLIYADFIFSNCTFSENVADERGGAVETAIGIHHFVSCNFEGNSAGIGGGLRLGSTKAAVGECSFVSNFAHTQGFAVSVVGCTSILDSSFDGNQLSCAIDSYRSDTEQDDINARFEAVCAECGTWGECSGCTTEMGNATSTCEATLEHTSASEPGLTLETLKVHAGYWRATNTSERILACYNPDACAGGQTGLASFCAAGYTGPYCAVCETDYSTSLAHTCTRCSSSRRQGLVAVTAIAALVAIFAVATFFKFLLSTEVEEGNIRCFRRRVLGAIPVQALKITVVMWQILTQFADAANVTYPGVYQDFLSAIDVVNFDLGSVLAAGCLWSDIDFHGRLLVSTIGPLVVVGFLVMTYMIAVRRNGASSDVSAVEKIRHKHQTALLLVTFLVYSSVSSMVFQTFACETLDDGIEYLRADYRIHCTDATHKAFELYAGIMVFVYPVGIPLLYAVLLFQRRDVLADAGADKTVAQPIAGLWEAYRPERFYYEVVECGRRILLTGVVVFIFPNDAAQIAITMLTAFFFFAVFEILSPYNSESDMWLSRGGHVVVFLSMFDLLLLKVDVSGESAQSQAAFAGVLVAGHVLIILAVVVEVVGICYASRKKVVEGGREASERPRVGSDDVPAFESAPAPWRSFLRQGSVSEKTGPTRSVPRTVVTIGGP